MLRVATIGKDGRTHAITKSLGQSPRVDEVFSLPEWKGSNPAQALKEVLAAAAQRRPDFVFVGPEAPLAEGVVDRLGEIGIPCVGPTQSLARLESSKAFTRDLLEEFGIPGNPAHRVFRSMDGLEAYLRELGEYVVKPDGLTGGKGVKLSQAHLATLGEGLEYCRELFRQRPNGPVVIEQKLEGEEFSLMSFCDGEHVQDMVLVQDHKRAGEGDTGPNTGGMGSYSCEDHGMPFVSAEEVRQAKDTNRRVAAALLRKTGQPYRGILYGGFMATAAGLRLLEYNARFGDPETLNALPLLETDFAAICQGIISGHLDQVPITFRRLATVCKYVVPQGYPETPAALKHAPIDLSKVPAESPNFQMYDAAVERRPDGVFMTGSRAIAFVGIGPNLDEAEAIAERAASAVIGPVFHRRDIGTRELIQRRIEHMRQLNKR